MFSPRIETDRLILRCYSVDDIDAFMEIIHDERLHTFISFPDLSYEQELNYLRDCELKKDIDKFEKWSIVLKNSNEVIGNISVNSITKRHGYCNVGYVIRYDYWGYGYAAEALKVVSDYLLNSRYRLVECTCNELNKQSSRVMEKAGFTMDGCIPNRRLNKDGHYSGVVYYSKTKDNK